MSTHITRRKQIGIQVFGEPELEAHVHNGGSVMSHCISIRNDHSGMPPRDTSVFARFREVLDLEFHDVEKREWLPPGLEHVRIPERQDVQNTIRFVRGALADPELTGFTIHCWRGVSRSTAIAAGIIYLALRDEERTMRYLKLIRPEASPLPRILSFWDEVLGSDLSSHGEALRAQGHEEMRRRLMEELFGSDDELEELPVVG